MYKRHKILVSLLAIIVLGVSFYYFSRVHFSSDIFIR